MEGEDKVASPDLQIHSNLTKSYTLMNLKMKLAGLRVFAISFTLERANRVELKWSTG
jgi:hypothetical protein